MYEPPAYWELKKARHRLDEIAQFIDLARKFRSMLYGGQLTLETVSRFGISDHGAHRVSLGDALKHETLEFLAQRCEDQAFALSETMPPTVDVRAACKV